MALPAITFTRTEGGLGRPLPGSDHISAHLFYTAGSLPSGFTSSDRIKKIFNVAEAEDLGILDQHADETVATGGQVTVTGTWVIGEIVRIEIDGASLGQFVLTATTITSLVAGLVSAINDNTNAGRKHGWVATDADPIITLVQPAKLGLKNDSGTPIVFVDRNAGDTAVSAGGSSTDVQMSGGVGSYFSVIHYHISEYFRLQPKGILYVAIFAQAAYTGTEIKTVQDFSGGEIRQMGVYLSHEVFAASQLTTSQTFLDTLETEDRPLSVVFHSDLSSATLSALATLRTLSNERTSMLIGEEGDYHVAAYVNTKAYTAGDKVTFQAGSFVAKFSIAVASPGDNPGPFDASNWTFLRDNLAGVLGFSIGTTGVALGAVSFAKVSDNIGHIAKFPLVTGTGLDEVAFATGDLWEDVTIALKDQLNDFGYIFLRKHNGISGTFFSDSPTAIVATSDFATIENVRTMDKAVRNIRTNVLPNLNAPLFVDEDGKLTEDTISLFKNDAERATIQMVTDAELSAQQITINPDQDVLATSIITIGVVLVPVGVARNIVFNIGFAVKIV